MVNAAFNGTKLYKNPSDFVDKKRYNLCMQILVIKIVLKANKLKTRDIFNQRSLVSDLLTFSSWSLMMFLSARP